MLTGRIAPSPSGRMHLGNVFSALLAWLSVRSRNGRMLLRIEDLDPDRCRLEYIETLKRDLDWLGLDWDAEQTPQSKRADAYHAEFERLRAFGLVYPCYCSRAELHAASAPHASDGNVIYAGTCRTLTDAERAAKTRKPAWRVIVPNTVITVQDGLQGEYTENLVQDCGDFIIRRSDGVYAYQLAVVTDDAAGGQFMITVPQAAEPQPVNAAVVTYGNDDPVTLPESDAVDLSTVLMQALDAPARKVVEVDLALNSVVGLADLQRCIVRPAKRMSIGQGKVNLLVERRQTADSSIGDDILLGDCYD